MSTKNLAEWMKLRYPDRDFSRSHRSASSIGDLVRCLGAVSGLPDPNASPIPRNLWMDLVGPRIADRSSPIRMDRDGTLVVQVADAVWAQELSLLSSTIVQGLKARGRPVASLRFVVAKIDPPRRGPTRFEHRKVSAPIDLPAEVRREVDKVEDPQLRQVIERAARSNLAQARAADSPSPGPRSSRAPKT